MWRSKGTVISLAKNDRLVREIEAELKTAEQGARLTVLTMLTLKYPLILLKEGKEEKKLQDKVTNTQIKRKVLENTVSIVSQPIPGRSAGFAPRA